MTPPDRPDARSAAAAVAFATADPASAAAHHALAAYFAELDQRFATGFATADPSSADLEAMRPPSGIFVLGRAPGAAEDEPVACGGVRTIPLHSGDPGGRQCAEIKRMWVHGGWRGSGLGTRLLRELEDRAADLGHRIVRLDTNGSLTSAIGLYRRAGYRQIDRYNDNPHAEWWFEKQLPTG